MKKIKVNLYINTRLVKTIKAEHPSNWDKIIKRDYKVVLINQKDIMNKLVATTILRPVALLNDPSDKEVNLNCIIYGGTSIE